MKKLNQYRAGLFMVLHYREIRSEIRPLMRKHNFAGVLQAIVNHLRTLREEGNIDKICRHIRFLGRIYARGNHYVKYILENLFIRSLRGLERTSTNTEWGTIQQHLPLMFLSIYAEQKKGHVII
ncbi:DUF7674 family protein [Sphingobacterium psychroaquaticum]|uniref:DUF7674 domain-containing protein n=1 Tax=Sphingobacterium psychroaquaticum TaxID=561061 RepID=A0A1X7KH10_9SPHI|nr:hypothetical protein [Sphingobacterium psychroaquaticum]QBQ42852.1 hypothetical protein E2P86_17585 [Sphingobacterium psychroaquaticum]SMG39834.1 hypothetical protein SAMN05660862_2823 [Sphingobacterium psychroaquaticum]